MLGIVEKFDDIEAAVAHFYEMRLRPTAHFPDQPESVKGHGARQLTRSIGKSQYFRDYMNDTQEKENTPHAPP